MKLQHVIYSQQFSVPNLMELFTRTRLMQKTVQRGGSRDYDDKIMATLFYKPSTRTRFSFEAAMYRLGGKVLSTESATSFSSAIEGEQLEDTIRIIGDYCDVIVLRHNEEGGAQGVWGAGHANMPNDIHNSAIEDTHEECLDLVQQGGGADSVNRYATDTDTSATDRSSRPDVSARSVDRTTVSRAGGGMSRGGSRR